MGSFTLFMFALSGLAAISHYDLSCGILKVLFVNPVLLAKLFICDHLPIITGLLVTTFTFSHWRNQWSYGIPEHYRVSPCLAKPEDIQASERALTQLFIV